MNEIRKQGRERSLRPIALNEALDMLERADSTIPYDGIKLVLSETAKVPGLLAQLSRAESERDRYRAALETIGYGDELSPSGVARAALTPSPATGGTKAKE